MMFFWPWPFLYAETHYRLPFLFNLLFKKEPEIIADLPHRITKSAPLPVLLLVKDAHKFPVKLISVNIYIDAQPFAVEPLDQMVRQKFKEWILEFDVSNLASGWHEIQIKITYEVAGKTKICFADNYRSTSHRPFRCYFAEEPLPRKKNFYAGDFHSHSSFTDDQIEFGASLATMQRMAKAIGLDFLCVTDHSYDLDDAIDNYLQNDPSFPKWQRFLKETEVLNSGRKGPLIIPGEEVSARNTKNQTVHLLILNHPKLIPGSGDSGENWFNNKSEFTIKQILTQIGQTSLAIPAHPAQKVPFSQKLFINRGPWNQKDLQENKFDGLQFINGNNIDSIYQAIELWKTLLLEGKKLFPVAGNDAHGHFNRVREISIPFVNLKEHQNHVFGQWKTVIHCPNTPQTPQQMIACFKRGRILITNGPFLEIIGVLGEKQFFMGQSVSLLESIKVEAFANHETGPFTQIKLFAGCFKEKKEQIIWQMDFTSEPLFNFSKKISLTFTPSAGYIRAEAKTRFGLVLTNGIWTEH